MKFPWWNNNDETVTRGFMIKKITDQDLFLIVPHFSKYTWNYDKSDPFGVNSELHWRSSLVDESGVEVSGGLPKFQDYGVGGDGTSGALSVIDVTISRSIASGDAIITVKEDGSLIIRSVYQGKVLLRTRGSHQLNDFEQPVMSLIKSKYPILLDPNWHPELDIFFEFISPINFIVIKYNSEDLVPLHAKERENHRMFSWDELEDLSLEGKLNLVARITNLETTKLKTLKNELNELEEKDQWGNEGVVVRDQKTGWMCRIKTDVYLQRHRLRFKFDFEGFVQMCEDDGVTTVEQMKESMVLRDFDVDWLTQAEDWLEIYLIRKQKFELEILEANRWIEQWKKDNLIESDELNKTFKKKFALQANQHLYKDLLFAIVDNKETKIKKATERIFSKILLEPVDGEQGTNHSLTS